MGACQNATPFWVLESESTSGLKRNTFRIIYVLLAAQIWKFKLQLLQELTLPKVLVKTAKNYLEKIVNVIAKIYTDKWLENIKNELGMSMGLA